MAMKRRGFLGLLGGTALAPLIPPVSAAVPVEEVLRGVEAIELPGVTSGVTALVRHGYIMMSWDPVEGAHHYEVSVDRKRVLKTREDRARVPGKIGKTQEVRVRGVMPTGDTTSWSQQVSITTPKKRGNDNEA